jgi:hypothetical protein
MLIFQEKLTCPLSSCTLQLILHVICHTQDLSIQQHVPKTSFFNFSNKLTDTWRYKWYYLLCPISNGKIANTLNQYLKNIQTMIYCHKPHKFNNVKQHLLARRHGILKFLIHITKIKENMLSLTQSTPVWQEEKIRSLYMLSFILLCAVSHFKNMKSFLLLEIQSRSYNAKTQVSWSYYLYDQWIISMAVCCVQHVPLRQPRDLRSKLALLSQNFMKHQLCLL